MNKRTLNRDVRVEENNIIITESLETTLDKRQIEGMLQNIKYEKEGIISQNATLIKRYDELELREIEYRDCLVSLSEVEDVTMTIIG